MKMIAHHAEGHDPQAAEVLIEPQEPAKLLLLGVAEDKLPVHDAGNTVVIGDRMVGRGFQTGLAHGVKMPAQAEKPSAFSIL